MRTQLKESFWKPGYRLYSYDASSFADASSGPTNAFHHMQEKDKADWHQVIYYRLCTDRQHDKAEWHEVGSFKFPPKCGELRNSI
jgi:hypothetical protein